ncbi:hypothetical protein Pmani_021173 [Petrolisthes manimaculis]|uniref:Uncharacterized protein n=1 Tax=Petrolisthes manimaculis TaxID=1843537 RepID=A0AAE1PFB8_9EUCA|nr:hypothetical protein Pmani_021173 [Petrolisthes manimaculis]
MFQPFRLLFFLPLFYLPLAHAFTPSPTAPPPLTCLNFRPSLLARLPHGPLPPLLRFASLDILYSNPCHETFLRTRCLLFSGSDTLSLTQHRLSPSSILPPDTPSLIISSKNRESKPDPSPNPASVGPVASQPS